MNVCESHENMEENIRYQLMIPKGPNCHMTLYTYLVIPICYVDIFKTMEAFHCFSSQHSFPTSAWIIVLGYTMCTVLYILTKSVVILSLYFNATKIHVFHINKRSNDHGVV